MSVSEPQAPRVPQGCDACGSTDTDPRHSHLEERGGELVFRVMHLDCCRDAGCPDGTCPESLARVGELRGASLVSALTSGGN